MNRSLSTNSLVAAAILTVSLAFTTPMHSQQEGNLPTQMLVNVEPKSTPPANAADLTVTVNNRKQPLTSWSPVLPTGAQVALLIDDGLRESVGRELNSLRTFIKTLPPGVEISIGYMQNGRVNVVQPFTTDYALAASRVRPPQGVSDASASPYFCVSDFVKKWPASEASEPNAAATINPTPSTTPKRKARFILMISNGVDPYNGSTNPTNEDSPYVQAAVADSQRAGVAVYSIYYSDVGFRGGNASFSGQGYLGQIAQATGGTAYFEGTGNPVSMAPFLTAFQRAITETYIATFDAPAGKDPSRDMVRIKLTSASKAKLHAPLEVLPGNAE